MPPIINIGLRVFGAAAVLVLLFLLIGMLLPHAYQTSAEVVIDAPPEKVFAYLNRLDRWPEWSQWATNKDSMFAVEYGPQVEGVGAVQTLKEPRGSGKLWITGSEPDRSLEYVVEFGDFPRMTSRFELQVAGSGTRLKWSSDGQLPTGPFYGWLRMAFVNGMKSQYQQALIKLDAVVTGKPLPGSVEPGQSGQSSAEQLESKSLPSTK
ncbi:MAG: SRPBCC family protein [Planctomycetota bacterium]